MRRCPGTLEPSGSLKVTSEKFSARQELRRLGGGQQGSRLHLVSVSGEVWRSGAACTNSRPASPPPSSQSSTTLTCCNLKLLERTVTWAELILCCKSLHGVSIIVFVLVCVQYGHIWSLLSKPFLPLFSWWSIPQFQFQFTWDGRRVAWLCCWSVDQLTKIGC